MVAIKCVKLKSWAQKCKKLFFWICSLSVPVGFREIWVERSEESQIHRSHDSRILERGTERQSHWPRHLQDDQVSMQQQVTSQFNSIDI